MAEKKWVVILLITSSFVLAKVGSDGLCGCRQAVREMKRLSKSNERDGTRTFDKPAHSGLRVRLCP